MTMMMATMLRMVVNRVWKVGQRGIGRGDIGKKSVGKEGLEKGSILVINTKRIHLIS